MKLKNLLPCLIVLGLASPLMAQMSGGRGTSEATINGKKISVDYGRPSMKGRDMLGRMQPGMVWRLGMNKPTTLETTGNLTVAGKELKAGKYSLWAKKDQSGNWLLAFHPTVPNWGQPELTSGYAAELPLKAEKASEAAEQLTISVVDNKGKGWIKIHWGNDVLAGSFDVK
jgi:hypothetical protein